MIGKRRKTIAVFVSLAAVLSLAACGGNSDEKPQEKKNSSGDAKKTEVEKMLEEDALKAIYDANLREKLLETYDSVSYEMKYYDNEGNILSEIHEVKDTIVEYCFDGEYLRFDYSTNIITGEDDSEEEPLVFQIVEGAGGYEAEYYRDRYVSVGFVYDEDEKVESVKFEDGDVIVESSYTTEQAVRAYGSDEKSLVHSMTDGDKFMSRYILNEKDLAMKELEAFIIKEDGTKIPWSECKISYNTDKITPPAEYTKLFSGTEAGTVTSIYDPGTEEEQIFTAQVPKGVSIRIDRDRELYPGIYSDPECTVPYKGGSNGGVREVTIYFAKGR